MSNENNNHTSSSGCPWPQGSRAFFKALLSRAAPALFVILLAMAALGPRPDVVGVEPLMLKAWEKQGALDNLESARAQANLAKPAETVATNLSTRPFWLFVDVPTRSSDRFVVFPSRHAKSMECFDPSGQSLGSSTRSGSVGAMRPVAAGFAVDASSAKGHLACVATYEGPARLTAALASGKAIQALDSSHAATGSMIEAGIGVLALFMLVSAWINKEAIHLVFGLWLALGMRLAAMSAGTDFEALGARIPPEWLADMRQWTTAGYFAATVALFGRLFGEQIERAKAKSLMAILSAFSATVLVSAASLSYGKYLPVLWVSTSVSSAAMVICLAIALVRRFDRAAAWYVASIGLTLLATFSEIVAAAMGLHKPPMALSSISAAVFSALMASLAVAERIRAARVEKDAAKLDAQRAYVGSPVGLFDFSADGIVGKANPKFTQIAGPGAVGARIEDLLDSDSCSMLRGVLSSGGSVELLAGGSGSRAQRWFKVQATAAPCSTVAEASLIDATEEVLAKRRLEFMASRDPLTGSFNLRGIDDQLEAIQTRKGGPVCLATIDLDRFKTINDLYGHPAGDAVLREVCARIQARCAPSDAVARVGGDEFRVVFADSGLDAAKMRAQAIIDEICARLFHFEGRSFSICASLGLAEGVVGFVAEELATTADAACRLAKATDARMVVAESGSRFCAQNKEEIEFARHLQAGTMPDGLMIYMQPIMSLSKPFDSLNVEVLLRLRKPDGRIIGAPGLIQTAEFLGKISMVDLWVLRETLGWIEANRARLCRTRFVSINLSGASLNDEAFLEDAFNLLSDHRDAASLLCLEITETVALKDTGNTTKFIERARRFGARIAIDDFGAGFAGFTYLRDVPSDSLKLDGSLVKSIAASGKTRAIIASCAGLASSLGMTSVGEFAEDLPIIKALAESGVNYAQGYGIAKPMPPEFILKATSSADFIEDAATIEYIKKLAEANRLAELAETEGSDEFNK